MRTLTVADSLKPTEVVLTNWYCVMKSSCKRDGIREIICDRKEMIHVKGELNRAHFAAIYVNAEDTEPGEVPQIALEPALGDVPAAFRAVAQEARHALNAPDSAPHGATGAKGVGCLAVESPEDNEKTPGKLSLTGGSNLHLLAVMEGVASTSR